MRPTSCQVPHAQMTACDSAPKKHSCECAPQKAERAEAIQAQLRAQVGVEDDAPVQRHHGDRAGGKPSDARRRRAQRGDEHEPEAELDVEGNLAVLVRHERRHRRADHQSHDAYVVQLLLRACMDILRELMHLHMALKLPTAHDVVPVCLCNACCAC